MLAPVSHYYHGIILTAYIIYGDQYTTHCTVEILVMEFQVGMKKQLKVVQSYLIIYRHENNR